ncbi:CYTH and CHAD domain-containing protein [Microvirga rosea]|uniref:CYTH and CHAD domain-containing protein n=1 Tax=Microvirga rosea TaxID=2715425 RepID=UPI001D09F422|nr:CYTH and CHAD domain-containing protein [Microvirga rosea]MCB8821682.1 CHAD domain-containing protein [Microvirga rosea]
MDSAAPNPPLPAHTPSGPREVELKLELAAGMLEDVLRHPALANASASTDQSGTLQATYFDTPDMALRGAGLSLRIRERTGRFVQTLKTDSDGQSLALNRGEWEWTVDGPDLDLEAVATTPLADFLAKIASHDELKPVFVLETNRRVFRLEKGDTLIEACLDQAEARAGSRNFPFAEVELELKRGDAAALFSIASELQEHARLRLSMTTKSERGYRLIETPHTGAVKAHQVVVEPGMTSPEAFRVIARSCLSQIIRNEEILRRTRSPASLHQMRVGVRRLKAAISFFEDMLDDRESKAVIERVRWIGKKLGHVRDIDVYADALKNSDEGWGRRALDEAERQRAKAYKSLLRTFEKPRFMRAILGLAAWIEAGRWHARRKARLVAARELLAVDRAARELENRWVKIRKTSGELGDMSDGKRHRLRIRIKELRYGLEFFTSTFVGEQAEQRQREILSVLEDLQDDLGKMNDLVVAKELFPGYAMGSHRTKGRMKKLLKRAKAAALRLRKTEPFWEERAADVS